MSPNDRIPFGLLDTSVVIDMADIQTESLPTDSAITSLTLAELSHGPHTATSHLERIRRQELLQEVEVRYPAPIPFDAAAARRYGSLVALVVARGRSPRSRRIDLMIAAIASFHDLPLFTRNGDDLIGLEEIVRVVSV